MTLEEIKRIDTGSRPEFASFAKEQLPLCGRKRYMVDILDKHIMVTDFRILKSKHRDGECLQLQMCVDGEVCVLFTGSSVLIKQIQTAADKIPFQTTIIKADKYYSFS